MARTKRFTAYAMVSNELMNDLPDDARRIAEAQVRRTLSKPTLRGPRGGAYVPFGEIGEIASSADYAWDTDQTTFAARRWAKYVRPTRK